MRHKIRILIVIFVICISTVISAKAQTVLDGSVGTAGKLKLPGPDFDINAEYGHQAGQNLFHSFQQFNVSTGGSATFRGPDSVRNIISRVTGGEVSWIDGTLRSAIPDADMYLLNPAGLMFGANARLDISGSFHVSTADYLRMGENDRFSAFAEAREGDVLSVAPPSGFGFLDRNAGSISIEGKGEITPEVWGGDHTNWGSWLKDNDPGFAPGLAVGQGKNISLISRGIDISGTYFVPQGLAPESVGANLTAPEGRISLATVKSAGEVTLNDSDLKVTEPVEGKPVEGDVPAGQSGNITLSHGAKLDADGMGEGGSGSVLIRGGNFLMDTAAQILSEPVHGDGGKIDIESDMLILKNESEIRGNTYGTGKGTDINLHASEEISIAASRIKNGSFYESPDAGDGGTLSMQARGISVADGSRLGGESYGAGKGGDISINASESLAVSDRSWIETSATTRSTGQAGDISVHTATLTIENMAGIKSETRGAAQGGKITISGPAPQEDDAAEKIALSGEGGLILAAASGKGNAGMIRIIAEEMSLTDSASVGTSTDGEGNAGEIKLQIGRLKLGKEASVASESRYPAVNIQIFDDIDALYELTASEEGDIAFVRNGGGEIPAAFIRTLTGQWIEISDNMRNIADLTELDMLTMSAIMGIIQIEGGEVALVENIGGGTPGLYVYDGFGIWIEIQKIYNTEEVSLREEFVSLEGDIVQTVDSEGITRHFVDTGETWIGFEDIHTVGDLTERDRLTPRTGDVAKVADAGDATSGSFIYDGKEWVKFFMTGSAGKITVNAEEITLEDDSSLSTASSGGVSAGTINLNTGTLRLSDRAGISSAGEAIGDAGSIAVRTEGDIVLRDEAWLNTATSGQGMGGDIVLEAESLRVGNSAHVSAESKSESGGGDAGTIIVETENSVTLSDKGSLTTESRGAGGGKIFVNAGNSVYLLNGQITGSVARGEGKGGDVRIASEFVILNHGQITANADAGDGGAVFIVTDSYLKSSDSKITATSRRGNDGVVRIEAPDTDISADLIPPPGDFIDAARWMKTPCAARGGEKTSRFVLGGRDAAPTSPDDWLLGPSLWFDDDSGAGFK